MSRYADVGLFHVPVQGSGAWSAQIFVDDLRAYSTA